MGSVLSKFINRPTGSVLSPDVERAVVLDLSGPALSEAFRTLLASAEDEFGIEQYVKALKFKFTIFQDAFADDCEKLTRENFLKLCMFMPTVRRRIGSYLTPELFPQLVGGFKALLREGDTDTRRRIFESRFPQDGSHRWVRDLAAEILHNVEPEKYPLMMRWVWDEKSNSGVLREVWYGDDVDNRRIDVKDDYAVFVKLREEISGYLTSNGIYRDVLQYVDLVCAHIYAGYIAAQGGAFLKSDFSAKQDPFMFTRRLLGLDGVQAKVDRSEFNMDENTVPDSSRPSPLIQFNGTR